MVEKGTGPEEERVQVAGLLGASGTRTKRKGQE